MLELTSKTGTAQAKQEIVFNFISDFRNFSHLLPAERLNDMEITGDTLRFSISGLGEIGLQLAERRPFSQLVVKAIEGTSADFTFWIHIAESIGNTSQVHIVLHARLNMFIEMMAKGPLQQFLDLMADKLETIKFDA
jgi:carbon monoxide dehydrogenase subunit G